MIKDVQYIKQGTALDFDTVSGFAINPQGESSIAFSSDLRDILLTIVGTGTGRTVISGNADMIGANLVNYINCYYGKKGAIDLVVQASKDVDIRQTADRRGNNVFSSYLAGIKTFADGAKKFLNVKVKVA